MRAHSMLRATVGLLTLTLSTLVPFGEDRTVIGATEQVIGTVVRETRAPAFPELQTGQIGDRYEDAMTVDGRILRLASNALFSDDDGNERAWKDFQRDDYVLFHANGAEIDAVILLLPR